MFFHSQKNTSGSLGQLSWQRFKKDAQGITALGVIIATMFVAVTGYLITADPTPFANRQILEISMQKPGFKVKMLKVRKNEPWRHTSFLKKMIDGAKDNYTYIPVESYRFDEAGISVKLFDADSNGLVRQFGLADVLFAIIGKQHEQGDKIVFTDLTGKPVEIDSVLLAKKVRQTAFVEKKFLLGTDQFGRDMLSRLIIGTRISLSVGFIAVAISLIVGIFLGSTAGFFRGRLDDLIMWFINVVWSIPTLLLVIAITFALGKGFWQIFVAVGLTMWVEVARVVRGQMMSIREKEYVEAAFALGYSKLRIIVKHILPNILSPVIVISAANFAAAILIEAGLSFLGIGVQPPVPSWGNMIKEYYSFIVLDSAYLALPGLAIVVLVLAFMSLGNALRDALDVNKI